MVMCIQLNFMCINAVFAVASAVIFTMAHSGFSQKLDDPPVKFGKKIKLIIVSV